MGGAKAEIGPLQVSRPSQATRQPLPSQFRVSNQTNVHAFGLWEETGVQRENPHRHQGKCDVHMKKLEIEEGTILL